MANEPRTTNYLIMQNKPNFLNNQRNIIHVITKIYGNFHLLGRCKNKAKTNPIKPNLKNAKMKLNFYSTKDYENEPRFHPPVKQTQLKPNKPNFTIDFERGILFTRNEQVDNFGTQIIINSL